jgi:glycine betaine/proline transport system ATP-binding protein
MSDAIIFGGVDIVFGDRPERALALMDQGRSRDEVSAETGLVLGVSNASLTIKQGEILVLMGLSGSGKSTLLRAVNGLAPSCAAA